MAPEEEEKPKVSTSFTEDLEIRYWVLDDRQPDNPDRSVFNYAEQVNRFNANASTGPWTFGVQVDEVALLFNRHYLDDELVIERDLVQDKRTAWPFGTDQDVYANAEKVFVKRDAKKVSFQVGDAYTSFGRGIALNVNRNPQIDIDTSIQGAKSVWRPGAWDVTAVIGQLNRQQVFQDNPNRELFGDKRHTVGGLRLERFGLGPANLGVHGVVYDFVDKTGFGPAFEELGSEPDALVGGLSAEVEGIAGVDWVLEGDAFHYPTKVLFGGAEPEPGYALYGSAAIYDDSTNKIWLIEVKRYRNAERVNSLLAEEQYEVAIAPTLEYERQITEDSSATVNSNDIWGARIRLDWTARQGLVPYGSLALFQDNELGGLHFNRFPETVVHPMAGIEWIADDRSVLWNVGHRNDQRMAPVGGDHDQQTHSDIAWRFPLGGLHGDLASAVEVYQWGDNEVQQSDYVETENSLTVGHGPWAVTGFTDFTTNPLVNSTGNLSERLYGALELQLKPTSSLTLKAFGGAYKAGLRCSGGQCRVLPGFEGARVSATGTF